MLVHDETAHALAQKPGEGQSGYEWIDRMMLAPRRGFVFLAVPKTGSTSIESAFGQHAEMVTSAYAPFKHTHYRGFQKFMQPFLAAMGFPRESYEVICAFREPIDWLHSWWRYRAREKIADPSHPAHHNYTGNVSFEEFVRAYMKGERFARVGRPHIFIRPQPNWREVDRVFRYDRLDLMTST